MTHVFDQVNPLGGSGIAYPRSADVARCRWSCLQADSCDEVNDIDVYGPVANMSGTEIICITPDELMGHDGRVEVRLREGVVAREYEAREPVARDMKRWAAREQ